MGLDAMVYAKGRLTDQLHDLLTERFPQSEWEEYTTPADWGKGEGRTWVVWRSYVRYYGPGYERGHWPTVATAIETVRAVFGHVYYHSDSTWYGEVEPHTVADTEALWQHWRGPNWDDYHLPRAPR